MAIEHVQSNYPLPLHELHSLAPDILWSNTPDILPDLSPVEVCQIVGEWYVAQTSHTRRHAVGQYLTGLACRKAAAFKQGMERQAKESSCYCAGNVI